MKLLSEYTDDVNRCARVYNLGKGLYQVNFWDASAEIDDWVTFDTLESAENTAEDWLLKS